MNDQPVKIAKHTWAWKSEGGKLHVQEFFKIPGEALLQHRRDYETSDPKLMRKFNNALAKLNP